MGDPAGLRVIEVSSGLAGAYCGWLLAGMGASVSRWPSARGAGEGEAGDGRALALRHLDRGKSEVPAPGSAVMDALRTADLVVSDDLSALERVCGSDLDGLARGQPGLVIAVSSVFGLTGPLADVPASGLDAQAASSVSWALGDPGRTPLSVPTEILSAQAGLHLAGAALMSLLLPPRADGARVVDVALADVLASYVAVNCRFYIHHGMAWQRSGRRASGSGGAYPFVILPCKDGQVCLSGRTRGEWERLVEAIGSPAWSSEPRYRSLRRMGRDYPEEVDALLIPVFAGMTKSEIADLANRHRLTIAPVRTMQEVLETPQYALRRFWSGLDVGGRTLCAPGLPLAAFDRRGEDAERRTSDLLSHRREAAADARVKPDRPLAGLRVVDLGWVWSAPQVGGILAQLGAEVIKVEHAGRPDNMRLSGPVLKDGTVVEGDATEISPMYHQINRGKQGVTLNLKDPRAADLLKRLVAVSDVVIENMSPGSLERAGLGYEDLRRVKPDLVMLAMSGAGQFGPLSQMRTYAPAMSSFVGLEALVGYAGEEPIGALNFAIGDPNAAAHGLAAVFAALLRRDATGLGSYIDLSQTEALLSTLAPFVLDAQSVGAQPLPRGNRHPRRAPQGIYPARGEERWIAITVETDPQWRALADLAAPAGWAADPAMATAGGRLAHAAALDEALAGWTAGQDADELSRRLRAAGVPATPVRRVEELWSDPQFAARGMLASVELPHLGPVPMFGVPWRVSDLSPAPAPRGPGLGEHNGRVFRDVLGLAQDDIDNLTVEGVIA